MKKFSFAPLIMIGACATCCAIPMLPALFAGALTSVAGSAWGGWKFGLGLVIALLVLGRIAMLVLRVAPAKKIDSCQM